MPGWLLSVWQRVVKQGLPVTLQSQDDADAVVFELQGLPTGGFLSCRKLQMGPLVDQLANGP